MCADLYRVKLGCLLVISSRCKMSVAANCISSLSEEGRFPKDEEIIELIHRPFLDQGLFGIDLLGFFRDYNTHPQKPNRA